MAKRTRRALDSTLLDDAVATQDTVTQLISAIRRVRRLVPAAAAISLFAHDYDQGAKPQIAWDDPVAKDQLVTALVTDALGLDHLEPTSDDERDALGLLALVAGQDVEAGEEEGTWRIARQVAKDRVISVVDPESRHMHKSRSEYRDGYKAHLAVEPETGLVTAAVLTPASTSDAKTALTLLEEEAPGLEVLADSAYGSGDLRAELRKRRHLQVIKPISIRPTVPGGFDRDDFVIDHDAARATCPAGITVRISATGRADFRSRLSSMRAQGALHHRQGGDAAQTHPQRPRAGGRPSSVARRRRPRHLSAPPAHGRALDRLAGGRRAPPGAFQRRRRKSARALSPGRRHQPAAPCRPRPRLRREVGARFQVSLGAQARGGKERASLTGSTQPGRPAHAFFMPALRFGHLPSLQHRTYAQGASCSTVS